MSTNPTGPETRAAEAAARHLLRSEGVFPGETIGPYRIVDRIGAGGMGVVYRADFPQGKLVLPVALKVLRGAFDEKRRRRFEYEAQALAAMDHEWIAKVHGTGVTEGGEPYLAMELVHGIDLCTFCDEHRLSIDQRIRLFQKICIGVEHAHRKLVVHSDLKPSNVLVVDRDGEPVPKLIDFGIARDLDRSSEGDGITEDGSIAGTREYMSPEQVCGRTAHIDTRTDVYALGVMLYQLLTGKLPFGSERLRALTRPDFARFVLEEKPLQPSARFDSDADASTTANLRATTKEALSRELRRDLDWIVLKAMAKEPERRYGSAAELAADLERYRSSEPVVAGPPSLTYRMRKMLRRRRLHIAAALIVIAIGIGALTLALDAREQRMAARRASQERVQEIVGRARTALDRADALSAEGLVPGAALRDAVADAVRAIADLQAASDAEVALETASLSQRAQAWIRDADFLERFDLVLASSTFGSSLSMARRRLDLLLEVFRGWGLDLHGDTSSEWLERAVAHVTGTPIKDRVLAAAVQLRMAHVQARSTKDAWKRPTELLVRCSEPLLAEVHRHDWGGREGEAAALLDQVLPRVVDSAIASSLALAAIDLNRPELAAATIDRLLLAHPNDYMALLTRFTLGQRNSEPGEWLVACARELRVANLDRPLGWVLLARQLVVNRDPSAAAECMRALTAFPDNPVLLWLHGESRLLVNDDAGARTSFEAAVALEPGLTAAWERLLEPANDCAAALPLLRRAMTADPFFEPLAVRYARCLLETGCAAEVEAVLLPCVANRWRAQDAYAPLAYAARAMGRFADAALYYRVGAFLTRAPASMDRAECLVQTGDLKRAANEALHSWLAAGEQAPAGERVRTTVVATPKEGESSTTLQAFADWLWRHGPEPPGGPRHAVLATLAQRDGDLARAAEHCLLHLEALGDAATHEDRLASVAAMLRAVKQPKDAAAAWELARGAVERLREAADRERSADVALFLEAQMWTAQEPLGKEFDRVLKLRRAGVTPVGLDAAILDVVDNLIALRNAKRPQY